MVTGSWTFDGRAALASYTAKVSSSSVYQVSYVRDSLGRVTSATETVQGTTLTRGFTYDSAGRVGMVTENSVLVRTYGYDPNGNRTSLTGPGLSVSGTYDAQDRLLTYGTTTYGHDRDGFLTAKVVGTDTTRYVYDALGNLLQVSLPGGTTIEYVVDAAGRRVGKKVNGVLQQGWLWQSDLAPATELDGAGAVVSRFVYATRPNVPDYLVKGGVTYRLVLDQLGSVRLVLNTADGTVAQRLDYDEFGRVTQNTNPGFQPFGYAGGLHDEQAGLVRFGARDYDPVTGQWTAKEPLGFAGGDGNLYAYAGNDPVSSVDPTGEVPVLAAMALRAAGCALAGALESMVLQSALNGCVDYGQVGIDALIGVGGCALAGGLAALRAARISARQIIMRTAQREADRGVAHLLKFLRSGERAAYFANPTRGSRFLGTAVHRATAKALGGRFKYATRGIDFVDTWTGELIELTTQGQLGDHVRRFGRAVTYAIYRLP